MASADKVAEDVQYLVDHIETYPDFPKPGISFK